MPEWPLRPASRASCVPTPVAFRFAFVPCPARRPEPNPVKESAAQTKIKAEVKTGDVETCFSSLTPGRRRAKLNLAQTILPHDQMGKSSVRPQPKSPAPL